MIKNKKAINGRTAVLSVVGLISFISTALSFLIFTEYAQANLLMPVPPKKPALETSSAPQYLNIHERGQPVQYSLKDFVKASSTGQMIVPVPQPKPFTESFDAQLTQEDAQRYKKIFSLQAKGDIEAAKKEMSKVRNKRLRGHVLYQRYMHPTAYISSFNELQNWLLLYADHPDADKIYNLALKKKPADSTISIAKPEKKSSIARRVEPYMVPARKYKSSFRRNKKQGDEVRALERKIFKLVRQTRPTQATATFESASATRFMDKAEQAIVKAQIAEGYLHAGKLEKAYELAHNAAHDFGLYAPQAGWVSGLVSWCNKDYERAAEFFESTALSPYASSWMISAGAYWAARAHVRAGNIKAVNRWLDKAAGHPRTFYGLIATRALGGDFEFNWDYPDFTPDHLDLLQDTDIGARAIALVAAGQSHLAEAELLRFNPKTPQMNEALLAYANHAGLPALSLRLGSAFATAEGMTFDAALYPKGNWKSEEAFKVDPALIHAIMRQESRFDHRAESYSGALGLMQLMPNTAKHVAGKTLNEELLVDPVFNIELGEKYLSELIGLRNVNGDLLSLLVAYNAGPGNLARWKRQWADIDDPLLFIELMPSSETREYVERVLSNYWVYKMRDGKKTPSLNALAKGNTARYAALSGERHDDTKKRQNARAFRVAFNP